MATTKPYNSRQSHGFRTSGPGGLSHWKTKPPNPLFDDARLQALQVMLCQRLDDLVNELGVRLSHTRKMYFGCCPVHGGDNPNAINLYTEGESVPGFWRCNTKHCEKTFKATIIGFVRGVLSHDRYDWTRLENADAHQRQRLVSFEDAVNWCCKFLGTTLEKLSVDYEEIEKRRFASNISVITRSADKTASTLTRLQVRAKLKLPSDYFMGRGWGPDVLDRYDVGLCDDPQKPFYNRVVVPIYDNDHKFVIGCTARSIFEACQKCECYHAPTLSCPQSSEEEWLFCKWRNSTNFKRDAQLYNYWFAKKHIAETGVAILVEGPPDLWRLEEAGIHVGLGMFGAELTDQQQVLLETSGAMNVIVLTNSDAAGQQAADNLRASLGRAFRMHFPKLETNDLGDMKPEAVAALLGPTLNMIKERGY